MLSVFATSQAMRKRQNRYATQTNIQNNFLHKAVLQGNMTLIEKHSNLISTKNARGQTALHLVMLLKRNLPKVFDVLMGIMKEKCSYAEKAKLVNTLDNRGLTVLHIAISKGYGEIVKSLIDVGADITVLDSDGKTVLHRVLWSTTIKEKEKRELINRMLKDISNKDKYEKLYKNYSLRKKLFLNKLGNHGIGNSRTAISLAISKGYGEIVKSLIDAGSDVTILDSDETTILHTVLFRTALEEAAREELIGYILKDIRNKDKYEKLYKNYSLRKKLFLNKLGKSLGGNVMTALHLAISQGYVGITNALIEAGADVTFANSSGQTALHIALLTPNLNQEQKWELINKIVEDIRNKDKYEKLYKNYSLRRKQFLNKLGKTNHGSHSTALNLAISQGYTEIAKTLIAQEGLDATLVESTGQTVLHKALWTTKLKESEKEELIKIVINNINDEDKMVLNKLGKDNHSNSDTVLNIAVSQGYTEIAKAFIDKGVDITLEDSNGQTVLHRALWTTKLKEREKEELIKIVINNINDEDKMVLNKRGKDNHGNSDTALNLAVSQGYTEIAKALIDKGVDITLEDSNGQTVLHKALWTTKLKESEKEKLIKIVINNINDEDKIVLNKVGKDNHGNSDTVLNIAVSQGYTEIAKALIDKGADITLEDSDGQTVLHKVLWTTKLKESEKEELIKIVINNINDEDKTVLNKRGKDKYGNSVTALSLAVSQGYIEIAKLLIDKGADVTLEDSDGHTPLVRSIISNNAEIFYYLLETKELNLDQIDKKKYRTPLQWIVRFVEGSVVKINNPNACRLSLKDAKEMIIELLKRWASLTIQDAEGFNVLHQIILRGEHALLKTILEHESGYNDLLEAFEAKSAMGQTPLELILRNKIKKNKKDVIDILLKARNEDNLTLRDQAQYVKKWNIIRELKSLK